MNILSKQDCMLLVKFSCTYFKPLSTVSRNDKNCAILVKEVFLVCSPTVPVGDKMHPNLLYEIRSGKDLYSYQ
jgi:hypothetical protein